MTIPTDDEDFRSGKKPASGQSTPTSEQHINKSVGNLLAPSVGVWGPPSTGKTVLLSSAFHHIQQMPYGSGDNKLGIRWGYEVSPPYGLEQSDEDAYIRSSAFLTHTVAAFGGGKLPPSNKSLADKILLELTYKDSQDGVNFGGRIWRKHILEVMDAPGENIYSDDFKDPYWQRLRACRAIMLIINGNNSNGQYQREFMVPGTGDYYSYNVLLESFLTKVCISGHRPFVAVCITQMDYNTTVQNYHDAWAKQGNPTELGRLLNQITDTYMYEKFKQRFGNRFQVFLTSATGWAYEDVDFEYKYISNIKKDDRGNDVLRDRRALPLNVLHALLWLLDCVEEEEKLTKSISQPKTFINFAKNQLNRMADHKRISNLDILRALYDDLGYLP